MSEEAGLEPQLHKVELGTHGEIYDALLYHDLTRPVSRAGQHNDDEPYATRPVSVLIDSVTHIMQVNFTVDTGTDTEIVILREDNTYPYVYVAAVNKPDGYVPLGVVIYAHLPPEGRNEGKDLNEAFEWLVSLPGYIALLQAFAKLF